MLIGRRTPVRRQYYRRSTQATYSISARVTVLFCLTCILPRLVMGSSDGLKQHHSERSFRNHTQERTEEAQCRKKSSPLGATVSFPM
jgi:hypothetical protein